MRIYAPHPLEQKILAMRGQKSYGLIALELGITRNVVAGVIFRHKYPRTVRVRAGHKGRGGAYPNTSTL